MTKVEADKINWKKDTTKTIEIELVVTKTNFFSYIPIIPSKNEEKKDKKIYFDSFLLQSVYFKILSSLSIIKILLFLFLQSFP